MKIFDSSVSLSLSSLSQYNLTSHVDSLTKCECHRAFESWSYSNNKSITPLAKSILLHILIIVIY